MFAAYLVLSGGHYFETFQHLQEVGPGRLWEAGTWGLLLSFAAPNLIYFHHLDVLPPHRPGVNNANDCGLKPLGDQPE